MAEFHSCGSRLPVSGVVGDAYFDAFNRKIYIAIADGRLVPLESLLAGPPIHGIDGAKGDKGDTGPQGVQGIQGPQGERGEKGERGEVLYIGPEEMAAAVKAARIEILTQRAKMLAAINQALEDAGSLGPLRAAHLEHVLARIKHLSGL